MVSLVFSNEKPSGQCYDFMQMRYSCQLLTIYSCAFISEGGFCRCVVLSYEGTSDILVLKIILVLVFIQFWGNNFYFSFIFSFEIILVSISVLVLVLK